MSESTASKLIILDRDGVINEDSDDYVKSVDEWIPIPGSIEAIAQLSKAGYTIVVATNQSGIGRGLFDLDALEAMNEKLFALVEAQGGHIDGIFYCPHTPEDNCACRKPKAGLIDAIEDELGVSARDALVVGDSKRDLEAGFAKGSKLFLVKTGKGNQTLAKLTSENDPLLKQLAVFDNLQHFAESLIAP
jgi:D-glycero-D-manno-heptose 1,7-bisphosphate phosphatase